jgi:flavorubredoxin
MSFAPVAPTHRAAPEQVAPDTWVLHHVQEALGAPLFVYLNSMVITGKEPMIIDTNTIANRSQWLDDAFGIVEPEDVRWVFLSHDDVDHTGNLDEVMERCVNATIVCNWAMTERHTNAFDFPLDRCRWVDDGESFDAGDRTFLAVRPPVWDSPTTRGLLDQKTGVYWGVDSFACPMPSPTMETVAEYDAAFWAEGMAMFIHNVLSPWLALVDPQRFSALCDRVRALGMNTIVTAHSPVITEPSIDKAFQILRDLPSVPAPPVPNQAVLEAILSGVAPADG